MNTWKKMMRLAAMAPLAALTLVACGDDESGPPPECTVAADCNAAGLTSCQVPTCNGGVCGSAPAADGAECSTGNACLDGETCSAGVCAGGTVKPADCGARECGNDACGNTCGSCEQGEICNSAGACEVDAADCGAIEFEGCCTASGQAKYCNDGVLETLDCPSNDGATTCGWYEGSGYDCATQSVPDPDASFPWLCPGESCGDDPCAGRECGFACGVACGGGCTDGNICNTDGQCVENPCGDTTFFGCCNGDGSITYCDTEVYQLVTIDCKAELGEDATCGWASDEDGYWCIDAQTSDPSGTYPYLCGGETCTETCDDRECGTVCGQTCAGTCGDGEFCQESTGTCEDNPCGTLGFEGCCDGTAVFWCENFTVQTLDCPTAAEGDVTVEKCGWVTAEETEDAAGYFCSDAEDADPAATFARDCSAYTFTRPAPEEPPAE